METNIHGYSCKFKELTLDYDKASVKRWKQIKDLALVKIPIIKKVCEFSAEHPDWKASGTASIDGGYIEFRFDPYIFNRLYIDNKKEHTSEDSHLEMYLEATKILVDEKDVNLSAWQKRISTNHFRKRWYGIYPEEAARMVPSSYPSDRFFANDKMLIKAVKKAVKGKDLSNNVLWFKNHKDDFPHPTLPEWKFGEKDILCMTVIMIESKEMDAKIKSARDKALGHPSNDKADVNYVREDDGGYDL